MPTDTLKRATHDISRKEFAKGLEARGLMVDENGYVRRGGEIFSPPAFRDIGRLGSRSQFFRRGTLSAAIQKLDAEEVQG